MERFQLFSPASIPEAIELYQAHREAGCMYISGGTDLVPSMRKGALHPAFLIDLQSVGIGGIRLTAEGTEIGAACTMKKLCSNNLIQSLWHALYLAAGSVGCTQTRGLATVGGNLCSGLPSMDTAPALLVYDAVLEIASASGCRRVGAEDFFVGPRKTCLRPGEILTRILLPDREERRKAHFIKFGRRNTLTLSIVNEAVGAVVRQDCLHQVRVAVGACAPTPVRIHGLEDYLEGRSASEIEEQAVRELVAREIRPIDDFRASAEYRSSLAGALVCKSLRVLTGRSDPEDLVIGGRE
ncbi:xanthine dehydrogenase family protein subunit M [Oscillibacter sp. MSJ-2]|uniref:Xanthine dehydrogenase family protein subunit M n=1 Tax=Dysosmobacter acutus TaxID=2841504 RepID=A0ABS6FAZ2_9FIRM|nr:xanthine dehydrogenase family protein subunit M [Dysosmobacter acutus]MBU5627449.1 xanthine dehydrogenase family protein subunit M [Dysosmobacter acutus]